MSALSREQLEAKLAEAEARGFVTLPTESLPIAVDAAVRLLDFARLTTSGPLRSGPVSSACDAAARLLERYIDGISDDITAATRPR